MGLQRRTIQTLTKLINEQKQFQIGNLSGKWVNHGEDFEIGRLPRLEIDRILFHISRHGRAYLVYSFKTPIGFAVGSKVLTWYVPDIRYSITTLHHQRVLTYITEPSPTFDPISA